MKKILFAACLLAAQSSFAQYWQQEADYKMDIDMNAEAHQFHGEQEITYTNNSPDTLNQLFYHLYFNAFQPNSMMDVRSRWIADPDRRVRDRIAHLNAEEIGYHKVNSLSLDGEALAYHIEGTVCEVKLNKPILPGQSVKLKMDFDSQVPLQIRRSGRDNAEGVEFSMTQWYPKLAEYDAQGWHTDPYIGREFHGIWGDFEVNIRMDKDYLIAATGELQNADEIGHGYDGVQNQKVDADGKLTWKFKAENVIDFAWAADPDYIHDVLEHGDLTLHFFYQKDVENPEYWKELQAETAQMFDYMSEHYGKYPYPQYSVVQGGDGGMEYPMLTLITGNRSKGSLRGVTLHEMIHSWYQAVLATNEAKYAWMDEGFNTYVGNIVDKALFDKEAENIHAGSYRAYFSLLKDGTLEPVATHSDHYHMNRSYSVGSYVMGAVYLHQLSYIIGQENLEKGMLRYYNTWKFKHPTPNDFKRVMEKVSGVNLEWYNQYFINQLHPIDYAVQAVYPKDKKNTTIVLERVERFPMPIDLEVTLKNGEKHVYYIPLSIMRGEKPAEGKNWNQLADWPWTFPQYKFEIPFKFDQIESVEIDPSKRMADFNEENNMFPRSTAFEYRGN